MAKPSGPPFTVPRYGSLGESIIAERDWLKQENERLRQYEPLKGGVPLKELMLQREVERMREEVGQLRRVLNPRMWTREEDNAWCRAIPDLYKAFEGLRGAVPQPREHTS